MGFLYFLKNIFKAFALLVAMALLQDFTGGLSEDLGLGIFLFILFFVTVSTTYDIGGGWFMQITSGIGLGGALVISFLIMIASYALLSFIAASSALVAGILLASFTINHAIETFRFAPDLPGFFTVTGIYCVIVYGIETVCAFLESPSPIFAFEYDSILPLLLMVLTVLFTVVNIIARATQADE